MLIRDIARELSGIDFLKGNVISEADEHPENKYSSAELCKESDLKVLQASLGFLYTYGVNAFRVFEGKEPKLVTKKDIENYVTANHTYNETQIFLEEKHFVQNTQAVFGHDCPYFGKLLYLYMAEGYDRKKISLHRFLKALYPLFDLENKNKHN